MCPLKCSLLFIKKYLINLNLCCLFNKNNFINNFIVGLFILLHPLIFTLFHHVLLVLFSILLFIYLVCTEYKNVFDLTETG